MKVLVDTNIWSLALRRDANAPSTAVELLKSLIIANRVEMIGPIRQELLSGISSESGFIQLAAKLDAYKDYPITTDDYVTAAKYYNICRRNGVQGSMTDFLICAVAVNNGMLIFTNDKDFTNFSTHVPIRMLEDPR